MAMPRGRRGGDGDGSSARDDTNDGEAARRQETAEQQQDQAMERQRSQPSPGEETVRREQGGHDRPVGGDHRPHPRPKPDADSSP